MATPPLLPRLYGRTTPGTKDREPAERLTGGGRLPKNISAGHDEEVR
jgi:hypothetical protein